MAGRGVTPSPPPPPPLSVVCCMCGDYGLRRELFRCKICITRFQHKYCSDLYPKAEDYQVCNWCTRDQERKLVATTTTVDSSSSTPSNKDIIGGIGGTGMKLHRGVFPAHLSKPVKKPKMLIRSHSDVGLSTRQEEISLGIGRARQGFRGKVRRYKRLEEVSS